MRDLVLVCDHASNNVPPEIGSLGLSEEDMRRHIAWDVGARGVTLGLARRLGAEAVLSTWSRLVIDPNRGEDDPTLVMKLYDGSLVPGNRQVGLAETQRRLEAYHRPYHRAIDAALDRVARRGPRARAGRRPLVHARSSAAGRSGPGTSACSGTATTGCCARCWRGSAPSPTSASATTSPIPASSTATACSPTARAAASRTC